MPSFTSAIHGRSPRSFGRKSGPFGPFLRDPTAVSPSRCQRLSSGPKVGQGGLVRQTSPGSAAGHIFRRCDCSLAGDLLRVVTLSLIHISEPTRQAEISYAVFCL